MHEDRNHRQTRMAIPNRHLLSRLMTASLCCAAIVLIQIGAAWGADISNPTAPANGGAKTGLYDVDASGTDVKLVLEALARQSGENIVVSPDVAGQLNMHIKQQTLVSILDNLAATMDVAWKKDGSTYLIVPKAKITAPTVDKPAAQPIVVVWQCHNVQPTELVGIVTKLFPGVTAMEGPGTSLPKYGQDTSSPSNNSISTGAVFNYPGENSSPSLSPTPSTTAAATQSTGRGDKIILMGPAEDIEKAKLILQQLDVQKRQVNIELAICELKTTSDRQVGVDWSWNPVSVKEGFTQPNPDRTDPTLPYNPTNVTVGQPKFLTGPLNFSATISAMVKNGTANLLAKPNISVLDGESGRIFLGDTVMYLQLDSRDRDGKPIYRAASLDAGISLPIAARILSDNAIMLTLHPAISLITGYSTIEGSEYPQVSTREVQTSVIVNNGSMLAIGGLIRDEDTKSASKVPLMGDLPVIGSLFRSSTTKKERTELIIFLSPTIMTEENKCQQAPPSPRS